jgi:hypothetical protein
MPKEYAHWTLAERVHLANEIPALKSLITDNKSLYELGAVIPDTPFYSFVSRHAREFLSAGWRLHGQDGENTFAFLSHLNLCFDLQNEHKANNPIWAFIMGIITHLVADGHFHPFTYHFSGSPFSPDPKVSQKAHGRHRMIETYLDLHYMQTFSLTHGGKLAALINDIPLDEMELVKLLSCLFFSRSDYPPQKIKRSLWRHKTMQSVFFSCYPKTILSALNTLPFIGLDDVVALFYPRYRDKIIPFFHKPFRYRHPVTGEMFEQSVSDLEIQVVRVSNRIFSDLESWRSRVSSDLSLNNFQGPSAYTGLPGSKSESMVHFNIQDVKTLLFSDT